jgi:hypothetical protein
MVTFCFFSSFSASSSDIGLLPIAGRGVPSFSMSVFSFVFV